MFVTSGRSRLGFTGYVSIDDPKGFCETVAEVMDAEAGEEDEIHPSKKTTSGGTSSCLRTVRGRARESRFERE